MKKILSLLVFVPMMVVAQTQTENYIKTKTYKVATATTIPTPDITQASQNITYFDGLGRPIQQVAHQQSGTGTDLVTPIEYDAFGRQAKDYLPYATTTAASLDYKPNALLDVLGYYATATANHEATTNPFSEKLFESSPLNRVLKQAAPGDNWKLGAGHEIKLDYQTNTVADNVIVVNANAIWNPTKELYDIGLEYGSVTGFYAENQLYKTVTYDENTIATPLKVGGSTVEFKDKEGRIVLQRTYNEEGVFNEWGDIWIEEQDTYYVYDQFGNLTFVIPPLVKTVHRPVNEWDGTLSDEVVIVPITTETLNSLCYQYKYDSRNRLVEKKLPGKQWEFIVYDKLDRVVATGPALSPFTDSSAGEVGWMITKYDVFNRSVYTGWESSTTVTSEGRTAKQNTMNGLTAFSENKLPTATEIDAITGVVYYTNTVLPTTFKLLTVNYYDSYAFFAFSPAISYAAPVKYNNTTLKPKGLPTGAWTRIPTTLASITAEKSYILYDAKARPVRTFSTNYLGGYNRVDNTYYNPFSEQLLSTITRHRRLAASTEIYVKDTYTYTPQDRLATHTHQIGTTGIAQLLASNTYDELGQLINKSLGNAIASPLQKVDYKYNIRGWLKDINDTSNLSQSSEPQDLFAFKISYDTPTNYQPLYNGNISETYWRTKNDNNLRKYSYAYDNLNRLKDAICWGPGQASGDSNLNFRENLSYDKNGNIQTLYRTGLYNNIDYDIPIDDLYYGYNGNQLTYVTDVSNMNSGFKDGNKTAIDFSYDANGNMTTDLNKGITEIIYNYLNLPTKITFGTTGTIAYVYNAIGQKVEKKVTQGTTITKTEYLGGYQYQGVGTATPTLQFFPTEEGYVNKPTSTTYGYVFNYTDHLGNVRLSYQDKNKDAIITSDEILEENNYYPFGMKHDGYNSTGTPPNYKYRYNSKEYQDDNIGGNQLNVYDYGWRDYDPAIGRFNKIDRFAEKYVDRTPYNYGANNPVYYIDVAGDSLYVSHNKGFLGLGGKETLRYENGNLYNKNGSAYEGKTKGFLKQVTTALAEISRGQEGSTMINELQSSNNNFTIEKGSSEFKASDRIKAYSNQFQTDPTAANSYSSLLSSGVNLSGGSGGTIFWNSSGSSLPTTGGMLTNSTTDLAHEMFHGLDANRGLIDDRVDNGVKRSEWQAVFRENTLRTQLGLPLRTHYQISDDQAGNRAGTGPRMLTPSPLNQPIRPAGYR